MKEYILLFNGRRRVYLVNKIKEYLKTLNLDIGIYLTDTDNLDPVIYYADKYSIVPSIEAEDFEKVFLNLIEKENIKYIFLWNNKDFYIFDKLKEKLYQMGVKIILPDLDKINICFDKRKTYEFCINNNITTPKSFLTIEDFLNSKCSFPVIVKPYNGAGNLNIFLANNIDELKVFYNKVPNPIIQEYIDGVHYTIDVFYDKGVRASIPRQRVKVRDAEVVQARIDLNEILVETGKYIAYKLKIKGPLNIQLIFSNNKCYVIDIHPRFGGGTDLSIEAGVPIHKWIVNMLLGIDSDYSFKINKRLFMTRYLKSDFIEV